MIDNIFKGIFASIIGIVTITTYYYMYGFHSESFSGGYLPWLLAVLICYGCYKGYHYISDQTEITYTPAKLTGFFLLHLLILSCLFFSYANISAGMGLILFFKILGYLIFPIILSFIVLGFGRRILAFIPDCSGKTGVFQFLTSLAFGLLSLVTLLSISGFFGFYNTTTLFIILIAFIFIGFKNILSDVQSFFTYSWKIDLTTGSRENILFSSRLLSAEFFFLIITFLISINFINIVRPMPIGWDDLGVYMNYPQLMATSGEVGRLGLTAWQVFTGIGYLFQSATQAFFLNSFGGIVAFLSLVLIVQELLASHKKSHLHLPLLAGMMYLSMPMIIFQLAKDMKLDSGLFFISAVCFYIIFDIAKNTLSEDKKDDGVVLDIFAKKSTYLFIGLAGLLAGFAFSIKLTTLLLISGVLGVLFFILLGLNGLFGYFSIYVAIFTKLGLWSLMNVSLPKDNPNFTNIVSGVTLLLGVIFFYFAFKKHKTLIVSTIKSSSVFLLGVFIALSPWIVNNATQLEKISITGLIFGNGDNFKADYEKIYTKEEIKTIEDKFTAAAVNSSGVTTNEDLGRYFGYEKGLNNYIKLPYNLTMQTNQKGEFTEISYWFLGILPSLLLFFGFTRRKWMYGAGALIFAGWAILFIQPLNALFTPLFESIVLPYGYAVYFALYLIPFLYFMFFLKNNTTNKFFKLNAVFALIYIFLWAISAFGIVWYGILMYFNLILFIILGLQEATQQEDDNNKNMSSLVMSGIFFVLITIYTFQSTIPHGMNNLVNAGYASFKNGSTQYYSTIFQSQPTYFDVLLELNIDSKKSKPLFDEMTKNIKNQTLLQVLKQNNVSTLGQYRNALLQLEASLTSGGSIPQEARDLYNEIQDLKENLYKEILYPQSQYKNTAGIYRIGTFLRYFINDNQKRLYEDSLIEMFDKYFYDSNNIDTGIERMKKFGVEYFLSDLNAATIDKDPRHALTNRYEQLLKTFTSDKIELVTTDSLCLRIGLEEYKKSDRSEQSLKKYMRFAGVNYESYDENNKTILRGEKQIECYNHILTLIQDKKISSTQYSYLQGIESYVNNQKFSSQDELLQFFQSYVGHGWMVLFKIK